MFRRSKVFKRIAAMFLVVLLIFTSMPTMEYNMQADAAIEGVMVTVVDSKGTPVEGASVSYNIDSVTNGDDYLTNTVSTDSNGNAIIIEAENYVENDYTVSLSINKEHYKAVQAENVSIISNNQILPYVLESTLISGIEVTPYTAVYDGAAHEAVSVSGTKENDIVSYKVDDGEWQSTVPQIENAALYIVSVKVEREGYEPLIITENASISKASFKPEVTVYSGEYDGNSHEAVTVSGVLDTDLVEYKLNDGEFSTTVPTVTNASANTVTVRVTRNDNFEVFENSYSGINITTASIEGIKAEVYSGTYDGLSHPVISITKDGEELSDDYTVYCKVTPSEEWVEGIPYITNAGTYDVEAKIVKLGDNGNVNETIDLERCKAVILKADQRLVFNTNHGSYVNISNNDCIGEGDKECSFDFSATGGEWGYPETPIEYSIAYPVNYPVQGQIDSEIAAINSSTGELTISEPVCLEIIAKREGNDNYNEVQIKYCLSAYYGSNDLIKFESNEDTYTLGTKEGVISELEATKKFEGDKGIITYSIDNTSGLEIVEENDKYKLIVSDYEALANAISNAENQALTVTVTAKKSDYRAKAWNADFPLYAECEATRTVAISFNQISGDVAITSDSEMKNGWYNSDVTVTPVGENVEISKSVSGDFKSSVTFGENDVDENKNPMYEKFVYLKDTENGGISKAISIGTFGIDKEKPVFPEYEKNAEGEVVAGPIIYETPVTEKILEAVTFGFYDAKTNVTFTAIDNYSGIASFEWYGTGVDSKKIKGEIKGDDIIHLEGSNEYKAVITIDEDVAQVADIAFKVTDIAGNVSAEVNDKGKAIVVDTVSPTITVTYEGISLSDDGAKQSFTNSEKVTARIEVTEKNFYKENVVVQIVKDGIATNITPEWKADEKNAYVYFTEYIMEEEGEYVVKITARDYSGNTDEKSTYESPIIIIDRTAPEISVDYEGSEVINNKIAYKGEEGAVIGLTVTEKYFDNDEKAKIIDSLEITDLTDNRKLEDEDYDVEWDTNNSNRAIITIKNPGQYVIESLYEDKAGNCITESDKDVTDAKEGFQSEEFFVDRIEPEITVDYGDTTPNNVVKEGEYNREYYKERKATITIVEDNFDPKSVEAEVIAEDISKTAVKADGESDTVANLLEAKLKEDIWEETAENTYVANLVFAEDANYTFDISYTDLIGNDTGDYAPDLFTIDKVAPTALSISYSDPYMVLNKLEGKNYRNYRFYRKAATVVITATDNVAGVEYFSIVAAKDGSAEATKLEMPENLTLNADGTYRSGTAGFIVASSVEESAADKKVISFIVNPQYRGEFSFTATDLSGNTADSDEAAEGIQNFDDNEVVVVDKIAPEISIEYSAAENVNVQYVNKNLETVEGFEKATQAFYDGTVTAKIRITEPNFFEGKDSDAGKVNQVKVNLTKTYESNEDKPIVVSYVPYELTDSDASETTKTLNWVSVVDEEGNETDTYEATITFAEDADYKLNVEYSELYAGLATEEPNINGNDGSSGTDIYESKIITVDTKEPEVAVEYQNTDVKKVNSVNRNYYAADQTAVITVTEHNFRASDIAATITAKYIDGEDVKTEEDAILEDILETQLKDQSIWAKAVDAEGNEIPDTYTAELRFATDANYTFDIAYDDLAGNPAKYKEISGENNEVILVDDYKVDLFTVDHEGPTDLAITYSDPNVALSSLRGMNYKFYKTAAIVTVTATDNVAGIEYFTIDADAIGSKAATTLEMPEELVVNPDGTIKSGSAGFIAISVQPGSTATKVLSFAVNPQYSGEFTYSATDSCENTSDSDEDTSGRQDFDDEAIVVVDAIAPEVSIEYEGMNPNFVDGNNVSVDSFVGATQAFYEGEVTAKIKVTEANFFEGEEFVDENSDKAIVNNVKVTLTKTNDLGEITTITYVPSALDNSDETETLDWIAVEGEADTYEAVITYTEDADYVLTVEYADNSTNAAEIAGSDETVGTKKYTSKIITVDNKSPYIDISYTDDGFVQEVVDSLGAMREYYTETRTETITITEHNFRASDLVINVKATDSAGKDIAVEDYANYLKTQSSWKPAVDENGEEILNKYVAVITYSTEANYTFDIEYADLAGNAAYYRDVEDEVYSSDYAPDLFTKDNTKPSDFGVEYQNEATWVGKISGLDYVFFNSQITVTVSAYDEIAGIREFDYSYVKSEDVSSVNAELLNAIIAEEVEKNNDAISLDSETNRYSITFTIPNTPLISNNQFNGNVEFSVTDRCEHSAMARDIRKVVVDNIDPTATVTFNDPVQATNGKVYYEGNIDGTIVINEANFYSEDVEIIITKDGAAYSTAVSWENNSADVHTGTFTLTEDGDYEVVVRYTDRSDNSMSEYKSEIFVIDTKDPVINVTNINHESANNDEGNIGFVITVTDKNIALESFKPVLTAVVRTGEEGNYTFETVTIDLGNPTTSTNSAGETVYTYTVENLDADGYYSLVCDAVDYAMHKVSKLNIGVENGGTAELEEANFSVNRLGSVFWVETIHNNIIDEKKTDDIENELKDAYTNGEVTVIINEVNADKIDVVDTAEEAGEVQETLLRINDGTAMNTVDLVEGANYVKNDLVGAGGWYKTTYTLDNSNFESDGNYSVDIISYDKAANSNTNTETGTINFTVDRTKPVIISNINKQDGMEIDADEYVVELTITDKNLDDKTISVVLDGEAASVESMGNGSYKFVVPKGSKHNFTVKADDLAFNSAEEYTVTDFTVSTNFFVRTFADPVSALLFIAFIVLILALIIFIIYKKKKKKDR